MNAINRRDFLGAVGRGALMAGPMSAIWGRTGPRAAAKGAPKAGPKRRPNFVFILIDDLGWADLSCYGSTYHESPNIDKLAGEGMRFTNAYAACCVCSPTRASIMTGKYPARLRLTDFIPGHWRPYAKLVAAKIHNQLPLAEVTMPEALESAGYVSACYGKWHLGGGRKYAPPAQGFDSWSPGGRNNNDKRVGSLSDQAIDFIAANKDKPFLLFLSHYTVHIRLEAPAKLVAKYKAKLKPGQSYPAQANPTYAAMIEHMDAGVARVLAKLDELKLADDTVVIFFSDNGGLKRIYHGKGEIVTSNAPLRDEKGTLYEGGIRVPLIVRWPGRVRPGSVCNAPVTSVDLLPTMLEMAGVENPAKTPIDGASLLPLLAQTGRLGREAIYWHYPHYHHTAPCGAVRAGDYKLIEYYEDGRLELYNLKDDIGEKTNLAGRMPRKAAELRGKLHKWLKSVGALMPTPNPKHDPKRAHQWARRPRPKPKPKAPKKQE